MATAPPFRSMVVKDRKDHREEPLEYYALTGLTTGQLHKLSLLVMQEIGSLVKAGAKKPPVAGLLDSVVMVVMLMRRNGTQAAAAAHFHCSQPTVSRRWDLLRPVIGRVLAPYVLDPVQVLGREGTALVDGTVCPVWDWSAIPDLYSGKAKYTGMNVQIACNLKGDVAAIGPVPVHRDSSKSVLLRVIAEAELPVVLRPRLPRPAVTLRYVPGWGAGGSPAAQGIARADVLDLRARPVVMIRVLTSRIVPPEPCPCLHHRWSMSSAATWMPPGWPAARTGLS